MAPSKPAHAQTRPEAGENDVPVTPEVERIIRQRLETFDDDVKAARPWDEVKARILSRRPTP
jgi:hypothetical protein